jgi:hypothetical protein
MNTLTQIILFTVLALLGIAGVICGLLGRKAALKKRKHSHSRSGSHSHSNKKSSHKGYSRHRVSRVMLFTVLTAASGTFALIFGLWGGYLFLTHALPASGYVKTDIVIEEAGYQNERFTANGIVYEALPLNVNEEVCSTLADAVFTYKTPGLLNGYLTGNYYRLQNSRNFDLIWNGLDVLFAPVEEKEKILSYYRSEALEWKYFDYASAEWDEEPQGVALSEEASAAMQAYLKLDTASLPTEKVIPESYTTIAIESYSKDGIVSFDLWFVVLEGKVYLQLDSATTNDQREELTLAALPDEISAPLVKLAETKPEQENEE